MKGTADFLCACIRVAGFQDALVPVGPEPFMRTHPCGLMPALEQGCSIDCDGAETDPLPDPDNAGVGSSVRDTNHSDSAEALLNRTR